MCRLARPFTKYNSKFHRAETKIEDEDQTRTRYSLAGEHISSHSSDLVFLQECETAFFDPKWNLAAPKLLEEYATFRCFDDSYPGTALLVKKKGIAGTSASKPVCIGGTQEVGGGSKVATIVPVKAGEKELVAVSVHFMWDGAAEKRQLHAQKIGDWLNEQAPNQSIVLGGDFNAQPGKYLEDLEAKSFLGKLRRAELPEGRMTGLSGDFSTEVCIDHLYASVDFGSPAARALAWPKPPWSGKFTKPAKVAAASDHIPIVMDLSLSGEQPKPE